MNNLDKSKLIYEICTIIRKRRDYLIHDMVAYHEDPVRFKRRIRLLSQLDIYESQIILKVYNSSSNDLSDSEEYKEIVKSEIETISNIYS